MINGIKNSTNFLSVGLPHSDLVSLQRMYIANNTNTSEKTGLRNVAQVRNNPARRRYAIFLSDLTKKYTEKINADAQKLSVNKE
jgi:hypothetical protein